MKNVKDSSDELQQHSKHQLKHDSIFLHPSHTIFKSFQLKSVGLLLALEVRIISKIEKECIRIR